MKKFLWYMADILTFTRIILSSALIVWGIIGGSIWGGFLMFFFAELTDAFDGTCATRWPFPKGKAPKYRKFAAQYDMFADLLLWFAAVLFFTLRINMIIGLVIMFGTAVICGVIELIVYGKFLGHPDNCTKNSLCARNFNLAKKIIMARRFFYLFTVVAVAIWILMVNEWPLVARIVFLSCGLSICGLLWMFLKERREHISRDAVDIEKELSKKAKK